MLKTLDANVLVTIHGGRLPDPAHPFGTQKPQPTEGELQRKRDENQCARHWLSTMGLGADRPEYRAACDRMDQRSRSPLDILQ
jgi:hypothetical protein